MNILFLCTENSARSLMAEALFRHHAPSQHRAYSAGTQPSSPSADAISTLAHFDIETQDLSSKAIENLDNINFDLVITLCENAHQECQSHYQGANYQHWPIVDPKTHQEQNAFELAMQEINRRVLALIDNLDALKPTSLSPTQFYKALSDDIRLKSLLLISLENELCVCELMEALAQESQPKVSRHLAQLKKLGLIVDRKQQQWVFYRINATLPQWMKSIIKATVINEPNFINDALLRLQAMGDRPSRTLLCCK